MGSKDKYRVTPQSTPMSSDDEMETSFTTEKGLSNPMYDADADSPDTKLSRSEHGLKSKGGAQPRRVAEIHAR